MAEQLIFHGYLLLFLGNQRLYSATASDLHQSVSRLVGFTFRNQSMSAEGRVSNQGGNLALGENFSFY